MIQRFKSSPIGVIVIILCAILSISGAQEYTGGSSKKDSSKIDHSVYERVKKFIHNKQKLFEPEQFKSNSAFIMGGLRGCRYGAENSPYGDSLFEICMQKIESKYVRLRELMINKFREQSDLSGGERLLDEVETYYPEAAGKMFRAYLDLLSASIDSIAQAYLYAMEPETSGVWRQFADLPADSMDSAIEDYVQKSAAEIYQVQLLASRSGERVQRLGEELIAFLSNYIRKTGKVY